MGIVDSVLEVMVNVGGIKAGDVGIVYRHV
jgi:hypothetical protein